MYWDEPFLQKLCTTFTTYPTWKTLQLAAVKWILFNRDQVIYFKIFSICYVFRRQKNSSNCWYSTKTAWKVMRFTIRSYISNTTFSCLHERIRMSSRKKNFKNVFHKNNWGSRINKDESNNQISNKKSYLYFRRCSSHEFTLMQPDEWIVWSSKKLVIFVEKQLTNTKDSRDFG